MTIAQKHGHPSGESAGRFLFDLFLQGDVDAGVRNFVIEHARSEDGAADPSQHFRRTAHLVVSLPEFQLG